MDEEFMNTLRNIGTKWYQCPKGHAYTIGECGLAMIESICPECGEKIGGKDHKLLKTNKLVDFDLDVKNNINITPVKVIKNNENENKEIKHDKPKNINKENENKNKENEKNEKDEKKEDKKEKIVNLEEKNNENTYKKDESNSTEIQNNKNPNKNTKENTKIEEENKNNKNENKKDK